MPGVDSLGFRRRRFSAVAAPNAPHSPSQCSMFLDASGVSVVKPVQYMDKWRLDRKGVRPVANIEVKKALGFK